MTADIHTLAGPYALDALPEEEERFFEAHLEVCPECRQEVAELRATASRLGMAVSEEPPAALKAKVMSQADITRQVRPPPAFRDQPRWWRRMLVPAVAALALVVAGLGFMVAQLNQRVAEVEASAAETRQVLSAPDLRIARLDTPTGVTASFAYSEELGRGIFVAEGLSPVGTTETYELWVIAGGQPAPAGLFRPDEDGAASHLVLADLRNAEALGVTIEPAGGSPQPTGDILISGEI